MNLSRLYFETKDNVKILRYSGISSYQKKIISETIRSIYGTPYSTMRAGLSAFELNSEENNQNYNGEFCSRIIAKAYSKANIKLCKNKNFENVTPADLSSSYILEEIEADFLHISETDVEDDDPLEHQEKILTSLMEDIRALLKREENIKVYSLPEVTKYIANNKIKKEVENKVAKKIKESGYLSMWKKEKEINDDEYDLDKIRKKYEKLNHIEKSRKLLKEAQLAINSIYRFYYQNCAFYLDKEKELEFKTFSLLKNLYIDLINNTMNRLENNLKSFYFNDSKFLNKYFNFRKIRIFKEENKNEVERKIDKIVNELEMCIYWLRNSIRQMDFNF